LRGPVREEGWGEGDKEKVTVERLHNVLVHRAGAPRTGT
jgi:hypothetical protein